MRKMSVLIFLPLLTIGTPAFAHPGHSDHNPFVSGFLHPLSGADHVLAMIAVGLAAALLGGRSLLVIPGTFVLMMAAGFVAALVGMQIPLVEPMILASTVVIGLTVALAWPASSAVIALVVGCFAFFHGYAHGSELAGQNALVFGTGFVLATGLLHAVGIVTGLAAVRLMPGTAALRVAGGAAALGGVFLLVS